MSRINHPLFRIFAFSLLVIQSTGCGSYRLASMPGKTEPQSETVQFEPIKVGVDVKIELKTGETLTGEVSAFSSEMVALRKVGNFGLEQDEYPWSDIQQIEVFRPAYYKTLIVTGAGLFVTYYALLIYMLSQMGD